MKPLSATVTFLTQTVVSQTPVYNCRIPWFRQLLFKVLSAAVICPGPDIYFLNYCPLLQSPLFTQPLHKHLSSIAVLPNSDKCFSISYRCLRSPLIQTTASQTHIYDCNLKGSYICNSEVQTTLAWQSSWTHFHYFSFNLPVHKHSTSIDLCCNYISLWSRLYLSSQTLLIPDTEFAIY